MKKNKDNILLWITITVLISSTFYFIYSCYTVEHFETPDVTMPSNIPSKKKNKPTMSSSMKKKKTKDKNLTLEESYRIKDKRLDETQTLNVWDVEWVKKNQDNKKLKKLWDELRILFP